MTAGREIVTGGISSKDDINSCGRGFTTVREIGRATVTGGSIKRRGALAAGVVERPEKCC